MKVYLVINDTTEDRVQAVALTLEQAERARDDFNAKDFLPYSYIIKEYDIDNNNYCDVTKPYNPMANF